MPEQVM